jgi:flagellar FliL protein
MSDAAAQTGAKGETQPAAKRRSGRWKIIAIAAVLVIAAAGGGAYFFLKKTVSPGSADAVKDEQPLPTYVEVKPFVVTLMSDNGTTRFVQIGVNLTLTRPGVAALLTAMLPQIADAMRLTVLRFKIEDVVNPAGIEKLREAITADLNRLLLQRLGAQRIEAANGGSKEAIQSIVFTTLVVE